MKVQIILDDYPTNLTKNKLYEIVSSFTIFNKTGYFVVNDDGYKTLVDISHLKFLDEIRNEKLQKLIL